MRADRAAWRVTMTRTQAAGGLLFLYLCLPFIEFVFRLIFSILNLSSLAKPMAIILVYGLLLLFCVWSRRFEALDFLLLLAALVFSFLVTYLIHPEYEYWYFRKSYGVWEYVLRPDNGLYIYLFLRLVNDPKVILRALRLSTWPMYVYYGYQLLIAMRRGYWIQENSTGEIYALSYNLSFGYAVLLFALVQLYLALEERKFINWCGAALGIMMILLGGSRGPILMIGIFLLLYSLTKLEKSRKKGVVILVIILAVPLFYYFYDALLGAAALLLEKLHISGRFFTMLMSGDIANDTGRSMIWAKALEMIENNPWGYGAMGSRHVISHIHIVGHPHQIFLELLIDWGVLLGATIIVFLLFHSVRLLFMRGNDNWRGLFIIFFARACQLLVSLTYWHSIGFWGALAIGICICQARKRGIMTTWKTAEHRTQ